MSKDSCSPGEKTFATGCDLCFECRELLMRWRRIFRIRCVILFISVQKVEKKCKYSDYPLRSLSSEVRGLSSLVEEVAFEFSESQKFQMPM